MLTVSLETLRDINPTPSVLNSNPSEFAALGDTVYFAASTPSTGAELWKTDGTPEGTRLVKDLFPGISGSEPRDLTEFKGSLYFTAINPSGPNAGQRALWKSDGTAAGTVNSGFVTPVGNVFVADGRLFFHPQNIEFGDPRVSIQFTDTGDLSRTEKFSTRTVNQFTANSTWQASKDLVAIQTRRSLQVFGKSVAFFANVDSTSTDGYAVVGNQVLLGGQRFTTSGNLNGELAVATLSQDGARFAFSLVKDLNPTGESFPDQFERASNYVTFVADDGTSGRELWRTDGTAQGTSLIKDLTPGPNGTVFREFVAAGDLVYFQAQPAGGGWELWSTDGTEAGTKKLMALPTSPDTPPVREFVAANTGAYFTVTATAGRSELWHTDNTPQGTRLVKSFPTQPGLSAPQHLHFVNKRLYFSATDPQTGMEPWVSDGTEQGTRRIADVAGPSTADSNPRNVVRLGDYNYFIANDGQHGTELWRTDGSTAGTQLVKDIQTGPQGSYPYNLTVHAGKLYFTANDGATGYELWSSDGTAAGTQLLKDLEPGEDSGNPRLYKSIGNKLYFVNNEEGEPVKVWETAGTAETTQRVPADQINPLLLPDTIIIGTLGSQVYYFGSVSDKNEFRPPVLMARDLQTGQSRSVGSGFFVNFNFTPLYSDAEGGGPRIPSVQVGGRLVFAVANKVWSTDGTAEGTFSVGDIRRPTSRSNYQLVAAGDKAYFAADRQLYETDGTVAGTRVVFNLFERRTPFAEDPFGRLVALASAGDRVYFVANIPNQGETFWSYSTKSGTAAQITNFTAQQAFPPLATWVTKNGLVLVTRHDSTGLELSRLKEDPNIDPTETLLLTGNFVSENQEPGTFVGNLVAVATSLGDHFTYSLVPGEGDSGNGRFSLNGSTLVTKVALDYERRQEEKVRIRATNQAGEVFERSFTIQVIDLNDQQKLGDINFDNRVDIQDFVIMRNNFGKTGAALQDGDINGDGNVDIQDFAILRRTFGK